MNFMEESFIRMERPSEAQHDIFILRFRAVDSDVSCQYAGLKRISKKIKIGLTCRCSLSVLLDSVPMLLKVALD